MNILQVKINRHLHDDPYQDNATTATVPVLVPDLAAVRALAQQLHTRGQEYKDVLWGWPVQYDPEIAEDAADFQIPTEGGGYRIESRPFWSPASFTIGESGVWFFSLLWENGSDQAPVEFLDQQDILVDLQFAHESNWSAITT